ncbi:MAG: T9SS type A sorting domain-containing protein [Cytophagaceae bacterium]|nr:T9SS type A sorting domain-containing protein [Cytophagaceae bacterium]
MKYSRLFMVSLIIQLSVMNNLKGQCTGDFSGNLIMNGDFESGTNSVASDYGYVASAPSMGKTKWTITTPCCASGAYRPATVAGQPADHTTGTSSGSYMLIDADNQANIDAWRSTVNVVSNTTYYFSAWISNVNWMNDNPAQLRFSVNGTQIGPIIQPPGPTLPGTETDQNHGWVQFFTTWYSGVVSGAVTVRMQNINTNGEGNDLAFDDIVFSSSCKFVNYPVVSQLPDTVSLCNGGGSVLLDSKISPAGNQFTWRLNGSTVGSNSPTHTATVAGTYYLCYDLVGRNCPKTDVVVVLGNKFFIDLGPNVTLCNPPSVTLDAKVTSPPVIVRWYKNNVRIPDDSNSTLQVTSAGVYRAEAFIPGNPACGTGTDNITINATTTATPNDVFYCNNTPKNVTLSVSGSGTYEWYANSTGSTLASGTKSGANGQIFTTAPISTDMTYWVEDKTVFITGGFTPANTLSGNYSGTSGGNMSQGTAFTASAPFRLDSVTVFATTYGIPPAGSPKTVEVKLYSGNPPALTLIATKLCSLNVTDPTNAARHPYQLYLGFQISTPGNYYLEYSSGTAEINGVDKDASGISPNYPSYKIPGLIQLLGIKQKDGSSNPYFDNKYLYFYNWIVGAGTLCGRIPVQAKANCVLPVLWIQFSGKKQEGGALLFWTTKEEMNNDYFIIERSEDGISFEYAGRVNGSGTSSSIQSYSYLDTYSSNSLIYYRLKQVDVDGTFSFSEIIAINNSQSKVLIEASVREDGILLEYTLPEDGVVHIYITDALGREILDESIYSVSGNNRKLIKYNLSAGLYFVNFISETGGRESKKLLK